MTIFWIIIIAIALYVIVTYNGFVRLRVRTKEALSDIDVQTKRRYDLIPNLIETVKGYASHEKETIENVTRARTNAMNAKGSPLETAEQENMLSETLKTLFAVSENYPDLKANANFLELQRELSDTEDKIMASRRFLNSVVKELNTKTETFPSNIIARMFHFKKEDFFEAASDAEKEPVKVEF